MDEVLYLARQGFRFLPAAGWDWEGFDKGKQPLTAWEESTNDPATLGQWASKYRRCNWWLYAADGVAVLDTDPRHGGDTLLAGLEAEFGKLPVTARSLSGRGDGGGHLFFAAPPDFAAKANLRGCQGLTLIAGGKGGVIVPPSRHPLGGAYTWALAPWDVPPASLPEWLRREALAVAPEVQAKTHAATPTADAAAVVGSADPLSFVWAASGLADHPGEVEGGRNRVLCRLVGAEFARGRDADEIEAEVSAWAGRCEPPMPEAQAMRVLRSLAARHEKNNNHTTPTTREVEPADGLGREPVEGGKSGTNSARVEGVDESLPPEVLSTGSPEQQAGLVGVSSTLSTAPVPSLAADAWHGLVGDIARAVEAELEGRVEGVVVCLLSCFGSAVGPGPFIRVGGDRHAANLFSCLVAPTGVGKSEPWAVVSTLMAEADPAWLDRCVSHGLGSGEGLVERLRDPRTELQPVKQKGVIVDWEEVEIPGADEKRCQTVEAEFGRVLTICRREGSTLAPTLCSAWDGKPMEVNNRGQARLKATGHHVAVWANITGEELGKRISGSLEAVNGFANRFLWLSQSRVRHLPFGGDLSVLGRFAGPLAAAIESARGVGEVRWSEAAKAVWAEAYPRLCDAQERLFALGRARGQALRLSLCYALLDGSDTLQPEHIRAGLAVWAWAEASATAIFGGGGDGCAGGPPHAAQALAAIRRTPGLGRSAIWSVVGHKAKASQLTAALDWLKAGGLAHSRTVKPAGGGRPGECWWPGSEPSAEVCYDGPGHPAWSDIHSRDNKHTPPPTLAAAGGVNQPRAEAETPTAGGGGKNSAVEETPAVPTPPAAVGEIVCSFHQPGGVARREAEVVATSGGKNSTVEETPATEPQPATTEEKVISFHQAAADATDGGVCGVVVPHDDPTSPNSFAGSGRLLLGLSRNPRYSDGRGQVHEQPTAGYWPPDYGPLTEDEIESLLGDPPR